MREATDGTQALSERSPYGLQRANGGWVDLDSIFRPYRRELGVEDSTPPPIVRDLVAGLPESEVAPEIRGNLDAVAAFGADVAEVGPL